MPTLARALLLESSRKLYSTPSLKLAGSLSTLEEYLQTAVISPSGDYAYFGTYTTPFTYPGIIVKVNTTIVDATSGDISSLHSYCIDWRSTVHGGNISIL